MTKEIIEIIEKHLLMIDPEVEQEELADDLFELSLLADSGELSSLMVDAHTLAEYDKYEAHFHSTTKEKLLTEWNDLKKKAGY